MVKKVMMFGFVGGVYLVGGRRDVVKGGREGVCCCHGKGEGVDRRAVLWSLVGVGLGGWSRGRVEVVFGEDQPFPKAMEYYGYAVDCRTSEWCLLRTCFRGVFFFGVWSVCVFVCLSVGRGRRDVGNAE